MVHCAPAYIFSHQIDKYLKKILREKFVSQTHMVGKAHRQEQETARHTPSTVRKQRLMNLSAQLIFPIYLALDPSLQDSANHISGVPSQRN